MFICKILHPDALASELIHMKPTVELCTGRPQRVVRQIKGSGYLRVDGLVSAAECPLQVITTTFNPGLFWSAAAIGEFVLTLLEG